ncbi:MAG: hypothetical protein JWQ35_1394 [Bacteriovoracaceae bacterium]|nr:hypothetical protein [Bacteriovoracaceae bacterium]
MFIVAYLVNNFVAIIIVLVRIFSIEGRGFQILNILKRKADKPVADCRRKTNSQIPGKL